METIANAARSRGAASVGVEVRGVSKTFTAGTPVLRSVSLSVAPGAVVALLGPSGCGKTTLLRTIAGLERPDEGEVVVGDQVLTSDHGVVPPERRRVGMVFQDWALFPHLSVAANVGYGLPRAERRSGRVEESLALVGLEGLGDRRPGTLSGGQQQRVALARALAPRPSVLLLDEPFSNLDTALRVEVRTEVHRLLGDLGVTTVFVTHDQEEAFVLGDEVAVMRAGVIVQHAPPAELYARPASAWVAGFVGEANLVAGVAAGATASTPVGPVPLDVPWDGEVTVLVRPECVRLEPGTGATVGLVEFYGHDVVYEAVLDDGLRLRVRTGPGTGFARGDAVSVRFAGPPAPAWAALAGEGVSAAPRPG
jgi:iron(III) transport system ATP-binding protein